MKAHFAKKSLGQNFLVDQNYIDKIIDAVDPSDTDLIVEIGPGHGALTEKLLDSGAHVLAVELDDELVGQLDQRFGDADRFRLLHQDALTVDIEHALTDISVNASSSHGARLVANLPYYISTAILESLSKQREHFDDLVLMFQREVVDRITAAPGNSKRGYLTVITEAAFITEKLFDVPPAAFRPAPKVKSSVVRLTPKPIANDEKQLLRLVSAGFAQKRKTIANNLKAAYPNYAAALSTAGIDPMARAEALSLEDWRQLNRALFAAG